MMKKLYQMITKQNDNAVISLLGYSFAGQPAHSLTCSGLLEGNV